MKKQKKKENSVFTPIFESRASITPRFKKSEGLRIKLLKSRSNKQLLKTKL